MLAISRETKVEFFLNASSHLVIYYVSQDSIRSPGQVSTGIYRYLQVSSRLVEVSSRLVEYTALLIETTSILSRVR